jgi:ribosomal protein S18
MNNSKNSVSLTKFDIDQQHEKQASQKGESSQKRRLSSIDASSLASAISEADYKRQKFFANGINNQPKIHHSTSLFNNPMSISSQPSVILLNKSSVLTALGLGQSILMRKQRYKIGQNHVLRLRIK